MPVLLFFNFIEKFAKRSGIGGRSKKKAEFVKFSCTPHAAANIKIYTITLILVFRGMSSSKRASAVAFSKYKLKSKH